MKLIIKNMVCPRCVSSVEQILKSFSIKYHKISLGEIELKSPLNKKQKEKLSKELKLKGFELLDDKKKQIIEKIKNLVIQKIHSGEVEDHFVISIYLSQHIFKDYSSISKLFSEVEGMTIEHYFILQKIEKVKELLIYNQNSLNEIAFKLGYSSPQYLSSQFKKHTGMTPSQFKNRGAELRKNLDEV